MIWDFITIFSSMKIKNNTTMSQNIMSRWWGVFALFKVTSLQMFKTPDAHNHYLFLHSLAKTNVIRQRLLPANRKFTIVLHVCWGWYPAHVFSTRRLPVTALLCSSHAGKRLPGRLEISVPHNYCYGPSIFLEKKKDPSIIGRIITSIN